MKKNIILLIIITLFFGACNEKTPKVLPLIIEAKIEVPENVLKVRECMSCGEQLSNIWNEIDFENEDEESEYIKFTIYDFKNDTITFNIEIFKKNQRIANFGFRTQKFSQEIICKTLCGFVNK